VKVNSSDIDGDCRGFFATHRAAAAKRCAALREDFRRRPCLRGRRLNEVNDRSAYDPITIQSRSVYALGGQALPIFEARADAAERPNVSDQPPVVAKLEIEISKLRVEGLLEA
jgi:hypothetical protein